MDPKKADTKTQDRINFNELSVKNIAVATTVRGQHVKILINSLKSLQFTNNTEIQFSENGMKFIGEESQFFQGVAYFSTNFFSRFHYVTKNPGLISIGVDFTAFSEFLSALINNDLASLKIVYYGDHRPIAFILTQLDTDDSEDTTQSDDEDEDEENGRKIEIVTEYIVRTKHSINPIDFTTIDSRIVSTISLQCPDFVEIIADLDRATEEIQFKIESSALSVKSLGIIQCNTQISFPSNHKIFKKFEHHEDTKFSYKFACFRNLQKALSNSVEICLETRENGLLKIQMMGKTSEVEPSLFYEFNVMPNVNEEEDEIVVE